MVEKITHSAPERNYDPKQGAESIEEIHERAESTQLERQMTPEQTQRQPEQLAEAAARHEVGIAHEAEAAAQEREQTKQPAQQQSQAAPTKAQLKKNFERTMTQVQQDMPPAEKTFSKVIHNPAVDKVSTALGSTVARPNLIIAGGLGTLIIGAAVYLVAKHYGYPLSGFEAIGAFILGWLIGAVIEFARVGFLNTKRS